jgi:hypothetical protein
MRARLPGADVTDGAAAWRIDAERRGAQSRINPGPSVPVETVPDGAGGTVPDAAERMSDWQPVLEEEENAKAVEAPFDQFDDAARDAAAAERDDAGNDAPARGASAAAGRGAGTQQPESPAGMFVPGASAGGPDAGAEAERLAKNAAFGARDSPHASDFEDTPPEEAIWAEESSDEASACAVPPVRNHVAGGMSGAAGASVLAAAAHPVASLRAAAAAARAAARAVAHGAAVVRDDIAHELGVRDAEDATASCKQQQAMQQKTRARPSADTPPPQA